MSQKIVSFEVAKVLKEAGYPQGITERVYLLKDYAKMKEGWVIFKDKCMYTDLLADIPTYLDAWLWLWQEKKISIDVSFLDNRKVCSINPYYPAKELDGPEEVIASAIEYLCEHNLIK